MDKKRKRFIRIRKAIEKSKQEKEDDKLKLQEICRMYSCQSKEYSCYTWPELIDSKKANEKESITNGSIVFLKFNISIAEPYSDLQSFFLSL